MTLTVQLVWGHCVRPWGYEVRCDFTDGTKIYNECMGFEAQPTQAQIDGKISEIKARLERVEAPSEPQYSITNEDGSVIQV